MEQQAFVATTTMVIVAIITLLSSIIFTHSH